MRRANISAITANLRAPAAFSVRAHPRGGVDQRGVTQRRQVADLGHRTIEHAFESNRSRLPDEYQQVKRYLWMKLQLWITQSAIRDRRTKGMVRSPARPS